MAKIKLKSDIFSFASSDVFLLGRTREVVAGLEVAVGAEVAVHPQDGNMQY